MFSTISSKIIIALVAVIIAMAVAGFFYFRYTQSTISTLTTNNARLEQAVQTQAATIAAQQAAARRQNEESLQLQQSLAEADTRRRSLEARIRRLNIESLARTNRAQAQDQVSSDAMQIFRDLERATTPSENPQPTSTTRPTSPMPPPRPPRSAQGTVQ